MQEQHLSEYSGRKPVMNVENMSVSIDETLITKAVDVTLYPGRITALVGESGSGKSLTALSLIGLAPAQSHISGKAVLFADNGERIELLRENMQYERIRGGAIGMIFQEPSQAFDPVITIGRQIEQAIRYHESREQRLDKQSLRSRVLSALREVELPDVERMYRSYPHELSGGQLQRAMIAMAMINRPQVLIADEPTTALDVTTQRDILTLMVALAKKHQLAVLLITHDMGVVWAAANEMIVMQQGTIIERGSVRDVFTRPQQDYTRQLLQAVPRITLTQHRLHVHDHNTVNVQHNSEHSVVQVEHVSARYSSSRLQKSKAHQALNNVSLHIAPAHTCALVGESGAGKTTLAKLIMGQLSSYEGNVYLQGKNMAALRGKDLRHARSLIGYVFQDSGSALNPRKTIGWSIAEPLLVHTNLSREERLARVEDMLDRVHLDRSIAMRYPHQLSGGQRQRVGIARALILQPKLLIADEPTSSLDVSIQRHVLELFNELQKAYRFACLLITHDLGIVQNVADTMSVMKEGKIVEQGMVDQVLADPQHDYTATLLSASLRSLPSLA